MKRAVFVLAFLLAACTGTSPEPDFYELSAVNGTPSPGIAVSIKVMRPSLPDYLDRPDIVRQESVYQYKIDEFHRWAEPLDRMIERILAEDLRQRLPASTVLTESDTGTTDMRYVIETDIQQFNAVNTTTAALKATLSITDKTGKHRFRPQMIELTAPAGTSAPALASALSDLLGEYVDRIAAEPREKP